jgi:hypothetical protein
MLAHDQVQYVSQIVAEKLRTVFGWAESARKAAESTIAAIGTFPVPQVLLNLPAAPVLGKALSPGVSDPPFTPVITDPVSVEYQETAQVTFTQPPPLPVLEYGVAVAPPPAPRDEVPTPPTLFPQASIPAVPDQPVLYDPAEPVLTNASPPALLPINVPDFTFPVLPAFASPFPVYSPPVPVTPVAPTLPYPAPLPTDLRDRITALLTGTTASLDDTREAMIDKLVEGADLDAQKAIDAAFTAAAARNFALPYGVLVDGVNDIRYAAGQKIRDGMSEINNRIAKEALANYQAGMELAMVLEKAYVSLYLEYARQVLEVEKLNVQIAIAMFDAAIALFNAQQQARKIHADAYKAQVQGIITGMGAYPTAIEGAVAETAENEQRIQMYAADAGLVKARSQVYTATTKKELAPVDAYKAEVGGVKAQADVIAANVDAYRAAVTAYAAGVGATTEVIGAFAAETSAKTSQAAVYTSNAKAYAQYVQEGSRRANVWKTFASAQGDVLRANVQSYEAAAEANQAFVRVQSAQVSAEAEIASARASAYGSGLQSVRAYNRATVDNAAASEQYALVAAENVTRAQTLASIAQAETDRINAGAMAAQTTALAGLAQGSMSAMHVSAGAEGDGGMSASAQWEQGASTQWGGANSWEESHRQLLSV